jgi:hypothetical protein
MSMLYKLFFFLAISPFIFEPAVGNEIEYKVLLKWNDPVMERSGESNFLPSLYFEDAVYSDSLPQIPVFIFRKRNEIPHFNISFSLAEKIYVPCTPDEIRLLQEVGFEHNEIITITDLDYASGEVYSRVHIIPIRKRAGIYEKLSSFSVKTENSFVPQLKYQQVQQYPETSVLSKGNWNRLCVDKDGIYRITFQNLVEMGMNPAQIDKTTIQLYSNKAGLLPEANSGEFFTDLKENAIWISGGNTGSFGPNDYILFFGQSPHRWTYNPTEDIFTHQIHYYSNEMCYFITSGQQTGKRVKEQNSSDKPHTHIVNEFYDYAYHHKELVNVLGSGKTWLGESFESNQPQNFNFSFPGIKTDAEAHVRVSAVARSTVASSFTIQAFNQTENLNIESIERSTVTGFFARMRNRNIKIMPQSQNFTVSLNYNRTASGGQGWLHYIAVNVKRNLNVYSDQMFFRNPSVAKVNNVSRYQISGFSQDMTIWEITDPFDIKQQKLSVSANTATFTLPAESLREFVVFRPQGFLTPRIRGVVANQNLHASNAHDLIIIVPDIFRAEAERLANFRRENDGLSVLMVTPQQVYNEFSSGIQDISAIRNFMKMYYHRAQENGQYPRYLLLFGNGTYDNKNILGYGGNLIPTFQTVESLNYSSSYISDDFFGLLDFNEGQDSFGSLDLGIGRIPVRTVDEARFVINKILRYDQRIEGLRPGSDSPLFAGKVSNYADWRNTITFIADDGDSNLHLNQTEQLSDIISINHPGFNLEKIYLDAFERVTLAGGARYPDVNKAIYNSVTQGTLLFNYVGHGGVRGLADERILTFDDILSWKNFYNLPIFMTATCEFSSFDQPDPNELSAGMRIFLKPDGGAVALFTTTRLAYSHSNFALNSAFMRNAFIPMKNGQMPRLGDLVRISKIESNSNNTLKNFVLLGDPSMQMAYPRYKAITTEWPDTLRALEKVTIKGHIVDQNGSIMENYQGIIYPTIYDKAATFSTLGNDPRSFPRDFRMQNRKLYKGTASIENGEYSFSFIVPRDISYNTGPGKISYYFDDGNLGDGNGYFEDFIVSGTTKSYTADQTGPDIKLYIDNTSFISGGTTGPNPILIAHLSDESGINTTGSIGHDIVAFLNGNTAYPIVLNDFYQADLDSHKSGKVIFPFFILEKGEYTLSLRAWDVHNNPSTQTIEFIVTSAPEITLGNLMNFPNPFSEKTTFKFTHNKPASELQILIDIFSLNGQLVRTIETNVYASGFEIPPIEWDGTDNGGALLTGGIYVFRVLVTTEKGDQVSRSERMVILR